MFEWILKIIDTVSSIAIAVIAGVALNSWKREIVSHRRKDLADKLLEIANFLEYTYCLKNQQEH